MNFARRFYPPMPDVGGVEPPVSANGLTFDQVTEAQADQESTDRVGKLGKRTKSGERAMGLMQVMPKTGEEMARKLGVEWRPDLMVGKSPEAAEYQMLIGRAYMKEGWEKYDGDVRMALKRYHGGPGMDDWKKDTHDYPDLVLRYVDDPVAPTPPPPSSPAGPPVLPAEAPRPASQRPVAGWHPQLLDDLLPHLKKLSRTVGEHVADVMDQSPLYRRRTKPPQR